MTTTEQWNGKVRERKCIHFGNVPEFMCRDWNPPIKTTITTAGLLYLTRSLPNTKRNCYYPFHRQLLWESITGQFQTLHKLSVKNSQNTVPPLPARQPLADQDLLIVKASGSHSDTPHSVGHLSTSDQPEAGTYMWQHTTLTGDGQPRARRDSNPKSQHSSGRRPTRGHSNRRSQIYVLIQSPNPRFCQWSLSKWFAHQNTIHIYLPIKPTHPTLRGTFVLIHLSVLFRDNVNSCGQTASEADE